MIQGTIAFPNLRAEMARRNLTISAMSAEMGKNRDTLSRKLSRKSPIYLDEAMDITDRFFPEHDVGYLFAADNAGNPALCRALSK